MRNKICNDVSRKVALVLLVILASCTVKPQKSDIEAAIYHYYKVMGHRVVNVSIGNISSQPISTMKYMGTKSYSVVIESLTLETGKDIVGPKSYEKGGRITFEDGMITIREDPGKKGNWRIVSVSSNMAP